MPYHISNTGKVVWCKAQTPDRCPRTRKTGEPHFETESAGYLFLKEKAEQQEQKTGFAQKLQNIKYNKTQKNLNKTITAHRDPKVIEHEKEVISNRIGYACRYETADLMANSSYFETANYMVAYNFVTGKHRAAILLSKAIGAPDTPNAKLSFRRGMQRAILDMMQEDNARKDNILSYPKKEILIDDDKNSSKAFTHIPHSVFLEDEVIHIPAGSELTNGKTLAKDLYVKGSDYVEPKATQNKNNSYTVQAAYFNTPEGKVWFSTDIQEKNHKPYVSLRLIEAHKVVTDDQVSAAYDAISKIYGD